MIQSAVTNVVTPAVAADDPDAFAHERVGQREQSLAPADRLAIRALRFKRRDAFALLENAGFIALPRVQDFRGEIVARPAVRRCWSNSPANSCCLSSETRKPRPNSALSSKSEFAQAGPRPSAFFA